MLYQTQAKVALSKQDQIAKLKVYRKNLQQTVKILGNY